VSSRFLDRLSKKKRKRDIAGNTLEQLCKKAKLGSLPTDTANRIAAPVDQVWSIHHNTVEMRSVVGFQACNVQ
jgi:hypothetical protein